MRLKGVALRFLEVVALQLPVTLVVVAKPKPS
jgi:hypothetical protein